MRILGNVLWFLLAGLALAVSWFLSGLLFCITVIGIPLGLQCFKFARLALFPFGKEIVYGGPSVCGFLANVLWLLLFGWSLALLSGALGIQQAGADAVRRVGALSAESQKCRPVGRHFFILGV